MFEWIFYPRMISNAYTLFIIYTRIDITPIDIVFLYCLLVCWGSNLSIQAKVGKLNGDLLQPSRIRYEVWSFSVRYLISIAYWKGLIFGVKLSVVVLQAIGISLRNRIGDSTGEFLVIFLLGVFIGIQCSWIALISLFLSWVWGHVFLVVSDRSEFCLSLSICLHFYLFFFLYANFCLTVVCTRGFDWDIHVYTRVFFT